MSDDFDDEEVTNDFDYCDQCGQKGEDCRCNEPEEEVIE